MKDSEASKASEASKSSQASYASIASPSDFILPRISFRGSKIGGTAPRGHFGRNPPSAGGAPEPPRTAVGYRGGAPPEASLGSK